VSRRLATLFVVGALLYIGVPAAEASNWSGITGATGCGGGPPLNQADDRAHYFWYDALTAGNTNAANWSRTNNYNPTVVDTFNASGNFPETDAVLYDQDYTNYCGYVWDGSPNLYGIAHCVSLNGAIECERHEVRYDTSDTNGFTDTQRRSLACHEIGHSFGLAHTGEAGSCMISGQVSNTGLTGHDQSMLANLT
jgi:Matrixin.